MATPDTTALLWDIDGTLLHSRDKLAHDLRTAFESLEIQISETDAYSMNWEHVASQYGVELDRFWAAVKETQESWKDSIAKGRVTVYEDSIPALEKLTWKKYTNMAVITRSTPLETSDKLTHTGLRSYFRTVHITPLDRINRPDKRLEAIAAIESIKARAPITRAYIIGDSPIDDIGTAALIRSQYQEQGIQVIGVHVDRLGKEAPQADYRIERLTQLIPLLG